MHIYIYIYVHTSRVDAPTVLRGCFYFHQGMTLWSSLLDASVVLPVGCFSGFPEDASVALLVGCPRVHPRAQPRAYPRANPGGTFDYCIGYALW